MTYTLLREATMLRTRLGNGRPLPNAIVKRAVKGWRQAYRGYVTRSVPNIYQRRASFDYLLLRNATGSCFSKDIIFCKRYPSKSTICEELLHAMQLDSGLYNDAVHHEGNLNATLMMEYVAASVLVENEARWAIPPFERKQNRMRLRQYARAIRFGMGGLPWRLRLRLLASANFLRQRLECWMGSSLRDR
jgi:hypothetical protein